MIQRESQWRVNGESLSVQIDEGQKLSIARTGQSEVPFRILEQSEHGALLEIGSAIHRVFFLKSADAVTVWHNGKTYRLEPARTATSEAQADAASGDIHAPMPGRILRVDVAVNAMVEEKQALLVMESMKMETTLHAAKAGRVSEIRVQPGQVVEMNALLLRIE